MTTDAVIERRKTVTRRKGWWKDKNGRRLLQSGDTLTLCKKVQGRRPGEPIERLAEVEVVDVSRETLWAMTHSSEYAWSEVALEGFPDMEPEEFVRRFFLDAQGMSRNDAVTRIEWRYICGGGFCECGGCVL